MATKLLNPLRREIAIGGESYMLTITPDGFKLVPKGKRKGRELAWRDLVSGEAALAVALNASLQRAKHPTGHGRSTGHTGRRMASSRSRQRRKPPAT